MGVKAADPGKKERKERFVLSSQDSHGPGRRTSEAQVRSGPGRAAAERQQAPGEVRPGRSGSASGSVLLPSPLPLLSARRLPAWPPPPPLLLSPLPLRPSSLSRSPLPPPSSLLPPETPAPEERAAEGTGRLLPPAAARSAVQPQPGSPRSSRAGPPSPARPGLPDLPEPARRPRSAPASPSAPSPSAAPGFPERPTRAPAPPRSPARTEEARAPSPGRPCPKRRGKSGVGPGGVAGVRRGSAGGERSAAPASLPGNPGTELGRRWRPGSPGRSRGPGRVATIRGILGSRVQDQSAWGSYSPCRVALGVGGWAASRVPGGPGRDARSRLRTWAAGPGVAEAAGARKARRLVSLAFVLKGNAGVKAGVAPAGGRPANLISPGGLGDAREGV